jgi:NAD-dependent deacetylase
MGQMDQSILTAARLIRESSYAVALTGAGISTPSGIPDFRSPKSGLWDQVNSMQVANLFGFRTNPQAFYDWIRPLAALILAARPNPAHLALSRMQRLGRIKAIITQNIDRLHTQAGSQNVIEVHGHMSQMTCIRCYQVYDSDPFIQPILDAGQMPRCPQCGGVLKPNVILFGEQLPVRPLTAARKAAARCDVMLVAGSSLEVAPACDLPFEAQRHGATVIMVNFEKTFVDDMVNLVIHDNVATVLPQIADVLEAR